MPSSRIRVCVRLRPDSDHQSSKWLDVDPIDHSISCVIPNPSNSQNNQQQRFSHNSNNNNDHNHNHNHNQQPRNFKFDKVLPRSTSQQATYDLCAMQVVRSSIDGYNGTIMAYGQTGAGKTYTTLGGGDFQSRGLCARAISHAYDEMATR